MDFVWWFGFHVGVSHRHVWRLIRSLSMSSEVIYLASCCIACCRLFSWRMEWILDHTGLTGQHRLYYLIYLRTEYSDNQFRSLKVCLNCHLSLMFVIFLHCCFGWVFSLEDLEIEDDYVVALTIHPSYFLWNLWTRHVSNFRMVEFLSLWACRDTTYRSWKWLEVGAKIPRRCLLFHVPSETSDIQQALRTKGYNGSKPSLWVFQVTDFSVRDQ